MSVALNYSPSEIGSLSVGPSASYRYDERASGVLGGKVVGGSTLRGGSSLLGSSTYVGGGTVLGGTVIGGSSNVGEARSYVSGRSYASGRTYTSGRSYATSSVVSGSKISERYQEKILKVPKRVVVREKIVEIAKPVYEEEIVEVPQYEYRDKIVEVPEVLYQDRVTHVPKVEIIERVKEVPQIIRQEKVVEVPKVTYRDVPVVRQVEVPQIRDEYVHRPVPVPQYRDIPVPQVYDVAREIRVPYKIPNALIETTEHTLAVPRIAPRVVDIPYPVYAPVFVEVALPRAMVDDFVAAEAARLNQHLDHLGVSVHKDLALAQQRAADETMRSASLDNVWHNHEQGKLRLVHGQPPPVDNRSIRAQVPVISDAHVEYLTRGEQNEGEAYVFEAEDERPDVWEDVKNFFSSWWDKVVGHSEKCCSTSCNATTCSKNTARSTTTGGNEEYGLRRVSSRRLSPRQHSSKLNSARPMSSRRTQSSGQTERTNYLKNVARNSLQPTSGRSVSPYATSPYTGSPQAMQPSVRANAYTHSAAMSEYATPIPSANAMVSTNVLPVTAQASPFRKNPLAP